jgi:CubicO group peptidase (beta-lactamase class C family)
MIFTKLRILIWVIVLSFSTFFNSQAYQPEFGAKIDALISTALRDGRLIGCNAFIYKDGNVIFYKSWGHRDSEAGKPIKRDTIFRIYSGGQKSLVD